MARVPAPYDMLIAGAGPAGVIGALSAARAGLRVLLIEARSEADTGHTCLVEVECGVFARCDVPAPSDDELIFVQKGSYLLTPAGFPALVVMGHPLHSFQLRRVLRRFLGYAKAAGVEMLFEHTAAPLVEGDRVAGVVLRDRRGREREIRARLVVDATGHAAALLSRLPERLGLDFVDRPEDHVLAQSRLYRLDRERAAAAAAQGRFFDGYSHHQIGTQGAYSTLGYFVSVERGVAFLLSGIQEPYTPPSNDEVLDQLADRLGFLTDEVFRGGNPIRIHRAGARLVADGFAAIGEAASMVIPSHASGIASGMLAGHSLARHAAEILRDGGAATTANLWPWLAAYQRGRGAVLATYDANRRFLQTFDPERDIEPLMRYGIMQPEDMAHTLTAEPLSISPATLPQRLWGMRKAPLTGLRFLASGPKTLLVHRHWLDFPREWNERSFADWKKLADRLLP